MTKTNILCNLPIRFLQNKLHGVMMGDLIMVAAGTGVGKSSWSRMMVRQAISEGVGTVMYSLEDEVGTFARKSAYRLYCQQTRDPMDYRLFKDAFINQPDKFKTERLEVAKQLRQKTKDGNTIFVVHEMKTPQWTAQEIMNQMQMEIKKGYKLFILDHFDIIAEENPASQKKTIDALWRFVSENGIALITFSQLSSARNKDALCPSIDDLRGSKSKVQTPTIVISLARHNSDVYSAFPGKPTYCRILKDRDDGKKSCAVVFYDHDAYLDNCLEVECNESGTCIDGVTQKDLTKRIKKDE